MNQTEILKDIKEACFLLLNSLNAGKEITIKPNTLFHRRIAAAEKGIDTESVEKMKNALEKTLAAMINLVRQLPTDDRLADYNLDLQEIAEAEAKEALTAAKL